MKVIVAILCLAEWLGLKREAVFGLRRARAGVPVVEVARPAFRATTIALPSGVLARGCCDARDGAGRILLECGPNTTAYRSCA